MKVNKHFSGNLKLGQIKFELLISGGAPRNVAQAPKFL